MIFFAHLDENNLVTNVTTASDDMDGNEVAMSAALNVTLKQTWADGGARKNFAGVGYTYDPAFDAFIPPKPFPSWVFNSGTCLWEAPTPKPTTGEYLWDEVNQAWVAV